MISYKIITQELYDNLSKLSLHNPSQKPLHLQPDPELIQKLDQLREQASTLEAQLLEEKHKNHVLLSQVTSLESKLLQMSQKISFLKENGKILILQKDETTIQLKNTLKQKTEILFQNSELQNRLSALEAGIIVLNQENEKAQKKWKLLQNKISEMNQTISLKNSENQNLLNLVHEKQSQLKSINLQLNKKSDILEKLVAEFDFCKKQKQGLQNEIQKFQDSPIPKLQQKIAANETWIAELTKTINELRQRCVELQMDRPQNTYQANPIPTFTFPYSSKAPLNMRPTKSITRPVAPYVLKLQNLNEKHQVAPVVPNVTEQTFFTNKSRFQETQKLKYLAICKQLVQQFNTKLTKIQQQKKSMQEKFQALKLKLNDYQYNQFKYKDKISLYLEKIQRYEKLTQKQQSEMENLILEFDEELNNVVKMKEEEVKAKWQDQISKYQAELQRLKEEEEITKKLEEQAYEQLIKHEAIVRDDFDYQILKQLLEQTEQELAEKTSELEAVKHQLNKKTKELQKYKESKQSYKQKALNFEEECYDNSIEIRRLKGLVQQLCQELQTKSNENQALRITLQNQENNRTNRSNGDSRLKYGEEFNENLSGKLSFGKNVSAGKRSGSEKFEYQFSQIDLQLQKRNEVYLNQIILKTRQKFQFYQANTPASPSRVSQHSDQAPNSQSFWMRRQKPSMQDSLDSINRSQISSHSQNDEAKQKELNSGTISPSSSNSSKNSYQSYGIKNLYKEKTNSIENSGHRFLLHKNSLQ